MAAPIAKGIIITASILVAAGIAFYENEQIREWIINSRHKLAIALHSLGDEVQPSDSRQSFDDDEDAGADSRRRRREEIIRLNRLELIKRAREDGIAVDLDELTAIGREEEEKIARGRANSTRSFDDIVGSDGMLRDGQMSEIGDATGVYSSMLQSGIRQRGGAGARGMDTGSLYANPFADEAGILFDHEETSGVLLDQRSRESSRTLSPAPLIDITAQSDIAQSEYFSEEELEAQVEEAIRRSLEDLTTAAQSPAADPPTSIPADNNSFYYAPPPNVHQTPISANSLYTSAIQTMLDEPMYDANDNDGEHTPAGTLTPTEDGFSTIASMASGGDDVGALSDLQSLADFQSVTGSIAGDHPMGDHDDGMSEQGYQTSEYSVVGASTPGSWTDVESEAGEEEGHQERPTPNLPTSSTHPASHA